MNTNVLIYNKYKNVLTGLNLGVGKVLEGVFNVDEIIDTFSSFSYDKMIIDITAIRDYQNIDNLQKLSMNINMENVIFLLEDNPETNSKDYLSRLVSFGIYNFTKDANGINYLLVHPHTYKDVLDINNLDEVVPKQPVVVENVVERVEEKENNGAVKEVYSDKPTTNGKIKVIGFKNVTNHAGATSLIYMLKRSLQNRKKVGAIEINKVDFLYFNDLEMISTIASDFRGILEKKTEEDIILVDLNDYEDTSVCSEVYYLIEPSTIMINRLLKRNRSILEKLKREKVIINKCMLNRSDIETFIYETGLKPIFILPPVDDREERIEVINKLRDKIIL